MARIFGGHPSVYAQFYKQIQKKAIRWEIYPSILTPDSVNELVSLPNLQVSFSRKVCTTLYAPDIFV